MISDATREKALSILNKNRSDNAFSIRIIETDMDCEVHIHGESVAVYQSDMGFYFFSLVKAEDFVHIKQQLNHDLTACLLTKPDLFYAIKELYPSAEGENFIQFVVESAEFKTCNVYNNPDVEIVPIDKSWVNFILSIYKSKEFGYTEYISRCIDKNPGFGALYNGEKMGYVLIHMDGELGSMTVTDTARGKGIGNMLMQRITEEYVKLASIGGALVLPENTASRKMSERACLRENQCMMWIVAGKEK